MGVVTVIMITILVIINALGKLSVCAHRNRTMVIPSMGKVSMDRTRGVFQGRKLAYMISSSDCMGGGPSNVVLSLGPSIKRGIGRKQAVCLAVGALDAPLDIMPSMTSGDSIHRTRTGLVTTNFGLARGQVIDKRGS